MGIAADIRMWILYKHDLELTESATQHEKSDRKMTFRGSLETIPDCWPAQ